MNPPATLGSLYKSLSDELFTAKVQKPHLEARILLALAADIDQIRIFSHPEDQVDFSVVKHSYEMVSRRKNGEPIAYITGIEEFWSLEFNITRDTLIPRPDSELVIETILNNIPSYRNQFSILDLGTGSGCLLLSLLSELPNARGLGIDISSGACKIAKKNAKKLGLERRAKFKQGDWLTGIQNQFDIIISNPPYIADPEIKLLDKSVQYFEPHIAISGGPDGLAAFRKIAKESQSRLKLGGILAVEIGINQAKNIINIFNNNGFKIKEINRDLSKIERCILATLVNS